MGLKRIGIRDFRQRLSSHLRELGNGDTLVITRRGKAIARLEAVELPEVPADKEFLELIEAGIVDWNGRHLPPRRPIATVRGPKTVADLLLEDRD